MQSSPVKGKSTLLGPAYLTEESSLVVFRERSSWKGWRNKRASRKKATREETIRSINDC